MAAESDCLFCKIVAGDIPSTRVYEDERVLAFEDVSPQMPVHVLVVPKAHYDNVGDGILDEELGHLVNAANEVARLKGIDRSGYRLIANTNDDACQTVHHVHIHVLGGERMNDGSPRLR